MFPYFSVVSLYHHDSLQDLITFLALVSTASWIAVLLTTLVRSAMRASYKRKTKRAASLAEDES